MSDWKFLDGDHGRYVRRGGPKKRSAESTPGYTPTTNSSHLPRPHPDLFEAAVNGHEKQLVALKTVELNDQDCLLREFQALSKLSGLDCVPKVREFNYDQGQAFIALEYLGEEWVSLDKDIQSFGPFKDRLNGEEQFRLFRNSLENTISKFHNKGVVHGDLKSNHIFIKKKRNLKLEDGESALDYSSIKIIDFGASYLYGETSKWRGGSIGFSNPYHWNHEHRDGLQFSELQAIDWYSLYAIFFHVYMGECFPVASPAFRLFINPRLQPDVNEYYKQLETSLHSKLGGEETLVDVIRCLCNPKDFEYPNRFKNNSVFANLNLDFRPNFSIFMMFLLFIGQIAHASDTVLESMLGAILFLFFFIVFGSNSFILQNRENNKVAKNHMTWLLTIIVAIGVIFLNGLNLFSEANLFPLILISTFIALSVVIFSSPILPNPLDSKIAGLLLGGVLSPLSIPHTLLIVFSVGSGIIFGIKIVHRNLARVYTYAFIFFVAINSWAVLEVRGVHFFSFGSKVPFLVDESLFLLNTLIWCLLGELSIRATYQFKKNRGIEAFIWKLIILFLAALLYQAIS